MEILAGKNILNCDKNFTYNHDRVESQLKKIDETLKTQTKNLFHVRKFDLHTLYKESEEKDMQDLNLLLGLAQVDDETAENETLHRQLKRICIEYGINNPVVGDE